MSRIFITGDVHCPIDIHKLNSKNFPIGKTLTKDDYVIICGDAGFIWDHSKNDSWWIEWISERAWTTLFVDGNHENFDLLNQYPIMDWHGGKVHKITDSLIHLMRGEIFELNGLSFFCFGGAFSTDIQYREEHVSWWQDELPVQEEIENAYYHLNRYHNKIDYVITHDISKRAQKLIGIERGNMIYYDDQYVDIVSFFDELEDKIIYKKWFNGHYHIDKEMGKRRFLYDDIIEIEESL